MPPRELRTAGVGRLDVELLTGFVAVVEERSIKLAARRLGLTPSAVSMQLRRLEDRVARPLLDRGGSAITLTEDGHVLLGYARRILDLMDEARMKLSTPPLAGSIEVGLPEWLADSRLQGLFARFARCHPDLRLSVRTDPSWVLKSALEAGEIDLALAIIDPAERHKVDVVYRESLVWVVGTVGEALEVRDELPLVLFDPPCAFRGVVMEGLSRCGWVGREVFTSKSVAQVQLAVQAGLGLSVLPETAVSPGMRVLGPREGFPELPDTDLGIYGKLGGESDPARTLRNYIKECLQSRRA